jgi:hypothetical protein
MDRERPDVPEPLERPYGDEDEEYRVVEPEGPPHEPVPQRDDIVDEAEEAAGLEAAAIGGPVADDRARTPDDEVHGGDPAWRPLTEAGQGQGEGFELAEGLHMEHAENPPDADLAADAFDLSDPGTDVDPDWAADVEKELTDFRHLETTAGEQPDPEARRAAEGGEADEVHSTEVVRDPDGPPDDPGEGPGITWER